MIGLTKQNIIFIVFVVFLFGVLTYLFIFTTPASGEIPSYVQGEVREVYEWAKTPTGAALLEDVPCYCGCKYEGHLHSRHCFWRDDGTFDKHGITCSVCLDIAKKAMQMSESGINICEIITEVDTFYTPNAHLRTPTPIPASCSA